MDKIDNAMYEVFNSSNRIFLGTGEATIKFLKRNGYRGGDFIIVYNKQELIKGSLSLCIKKVTLNELERELNTKNELENKLWNLKNKLQNKNSTYNKINIIILIIMTICTLLNIPYVAPILLIPVFYIFIDKKSIFKKIREYDEKSNDVACDIDNIDEKISEVKREINKIINNDFEETTNKLNISKSNELEKSDSLTEFQKIKKD